jgi:hypothetical protein
VVYLDAKSDTYLEEVSSCNIFVRKGKTIKTPPLGGTILPGKPAGWAQRCRVVVVPFERVLWSRGDLSV